MKDLNIKARPFLKWAGGKTKLLPEIESRLPSNLKGTYIEPFIGGGSVMFWMAQQYNFDRIIINDINQDVADSYITIKYDHISLLSKLEELQSQFLKLKTVEEKNIFFLENRNKFNQRNNSSLDNTALMIFLNKTCFNGLYRVNKKNEFNVPFNKVLNSTLYDIDNIIACNKLLQNVTILNGDYSETLKYIDKDTFMYFDPPYKPISTTSSFNSYNKENFEDLEQKRLSEYCNLCNEKGAKWLLSNSDMKNNDAEDNFFDDMYKEYNIKRILSKRMINSDGTKRGEINEILISNF